MFKHTPKMIGLCGQPGHGKSTAQTILHEVFGVEPIDDGLPLRLEAMKRFGLTWEQVSTQAGKMEYVEAFGRRMTVRNVLGDIGLEHEREDINWVIRTAIDVVLSCDEISPVSFGSVRRQQGGLIKQNGGLVIELRDPWRAESEHLFDQYDRSFIDHTIVNPGTIEDLTALLEPVVLPYLTNQG